MLTDFDGQVRKMEFGKEENLRNRSRPVERGLVCVAGTNGA